MTTSHDRKALLTSANDRPDKQSHVSLKKVIIMTSLLIIAVILIIIFVIDVFNVFEDQSSSKAGLIGLWPTYGGGIKNQQVSPYYATDTTLSNTNVHTIQTKCIYESPDGIAFIGYATIDTSNNSYFADANGYITCINLDTCDVCWRQHVGSLLGYENFNVSVHQTLTIFRDSKGVEGLLFGAPSHRSLGNPTYPDDLGCYALAVHLEDGSFWWKVQIGEDYAHQDYKCGSHGFYVDDHYAYGGFSQPCCYDNNNDKANFIGRFLKIDIDEREIVNTWYPFNYNLTEEIDEYNLSYSGVSAYGFPAIDDQYVVFGTANLWTVPYKIAECMVHTDNNEFPNYTELNEIVSEDICGNNQTLNAYFRCLEKTIYPSSLIVLDKNTFKMKHSYQLMGLDTSGGAARRLWASFNNSNIEDLNIDLTAVALYKNKLNNKRYVAAVNKAHTIYVFELDTGEIHFIKRYGPPVREAQFNIAIDENNLIGITTINGAHFGAHFGADGFIWYELANGIRVCEGTAVAVAFNLYNGKTLWQIVNPYGTINESICYNDTYYEWTAHRANVMDSIICEQLIDENNNDDILVHIPPKSNKTLTPMLSKIRAGFRGQIAIHNEMVFIPSDTGDVFVHHLYNGSFIHRFVCPPQLVNDTYNRASIRSGISVANDRIVYYCGGYKMAPDAVMNGNKFVSLKLP